MTGHEHVEHVGIGEVLQAGLLQLQSHRNRQHQPNNPADHGEDEVHGADVFVVGRVQPAPSAGGSVVVIVGPASGVMHAESSSPHMVRFTNARHVMPVPDVVATAYPLGLAVIVERIDCACVGLTHTRWETTPAHLR